MIYLNNIFCFCLSQIKTTYKNLTTKQDIIVANKSVLHGVKMNGRLIIQSIQKVQGLGKYDGYSLVVVNDKTKDSYKIDFLCETS